MLDAEAETNGGERALMAALCGCNPGGKLLAFGVTSEGIALPAAALGGNGSTTRVGGAGGKLFNVGAVEDGAGAFCTVPAAGNNPGGADAEEADLAGDKIPGGADGAA